MQRGACPRTGEPKNLIDVLSTVEPPKLRNDGHAFAEATPIDSGTRSTGELISAGFREGFETCDFSIPFVLLEREEEWV